MHRKEARSASAGSSRSGGGGGGPGGFSSGGSGGFSGGVQVNIDSFCATIMLFHKKGHDIKCFFL